MLRKQDEKKNTYWFIYYRTLSKNSITLHISTQDSTYTSDV